MMNGQEVFNLWMQCGPLNIDVFQKHFCGPINHWSYVITGQDEDWWWNGEIWIQNNGECINWKNNFLKEYYTWDDVLEPLPNAILQADENEAW